MYSQITTSGANNLAAKPLFNISRNHYFWTHLDINLNNLKYTEILTKNILISGQHVKLFMVPTTQRQSCCLIYSEITTFVPTQISFMLRMKNIDHNNLKYTEILTKNTLISGQHIKLLPVPTTQRRRRYLIYSKITAFVTTQIIHKNLNKKHTNLRTTC